MEKHPSHKLVLLKDIVKAIHEFEAAGKNPHGPNEAKPGHVPVMLELRRGGPPVRVNYSSWPVDPAEELPLHPHDLDPETRAQLKGAGILTKHKVIYPMTKAYIKEQWHRVYAYDTTAKNITDVRLLVTDKQDPNYSAKGYKSAHGWTIPMQKETEPIFEKILMEKEINKKFPEGPPLA